MKILAIDTSTIAASVAVADEEKLYGEFFTDFKLKHSEKIMPMVDDLFKSLRMSIDDIDVFATSVGPGSFTGIRIGIATIKAFAQAKQKPVVGVSSLKACAYQFSDIKGQIAVIFDAQRNQVYYSMYDFSADNDVEAVEKVISIDEVINELSDANVLFCGDGVKKYKSQILSAGHRIASDILIMPRASSVARLAVSEALKGNTVTYKDILPIYLRRSQAEENLRS